MVKWFYYKHPKTGKIFSDQRMEGFEKKPYKTLDGTECELVQDYEPPREEHSNQLGIINKNAEVFEKDPDYIRKVKPKYVKYRDGHRELYNPNKHF